MGEFRIGRKHAQHSYPESRRNTTLPFARNFAQGPATQTLVPTPAGLQIPWATIESGAPAGPDVPITPHVTGRILLTGMLTLTNTSIAATERADVVAQIGGVSLPVPLAQVSIPPGGFATIPFDREIAVLPVGVATNIEIFITSTTNNTIALTIQSSTLNLQEVATGTG